MTLTEMLEANSIPEPNSGCWLWLRGVDRSSPGWEYPIWRWDNRPRRVSHLALELRGVTVPQGFCACHRCDVPLCVNPDHLFVGTQADNVHDAKRKGRFVGRLKRETCKYGHPLSGDNLHVSSKDGERVCRACARRRYLKWRESRG
jgi:hypothetical protein